MLTIKSFFCAVSSYNRKKGIAMIFYFSGTGNSLYAAQKLSKVLQEPLCNMADMLSKKQFLYTLKEKERLEKRIKQLEKEHQECLEKRVSLR